MPKAMIFLIQFVSILYFAINKTISQKNQVTMENLLNLNYYSISVTFPYSNKALGPNGISKYL